MATCTRLCRVTKIKPDKTKQLIAFAETEAGKRVFVPARVRCIADLRQVGDRAKLVLIRSDQGGYKAIDTAKETSIAWQHWQTNPELLDTEAGDNINLAFDCWSCGTAILQPMDIFKLKSGAVWTNGMPRTIQAYGDTIYNKDKRTFVQNARCVGCGHQFGTFHAERYETCGDDRCFPCVKLNVARRRYEDQVMVHGIAVNAEYKAALDALKGAGRGFTERVGRHTYELAEQVKEMNLNQRQERQLQEKKVQQARQREQQAEQQAEQERQRAQQERQRAEEMAQDARRQRQLAAEAEAEAKKAEAGAKKAISEAQDTVRRLKHIVSESQQHVWECETDAGWKPFDSEICEALQKQAMKPVPQPWQFRRGRFTYHVDVVNKVQTNMQTQKKRAIRCHASAPGRMLLQPQKPGQHVAPGVVKHTLRHQGERAQSTMTYESYHFNQAVAQCTLMTKRKVNVTHVDCYENPALVRKFDDTATKLGDDEEVWVFHGTSSDSVPSIMQNGFLVGGDGVAIKNGAAFGRGVYTATGPDTPMGYAGSQSRQIILARARRGKCIGGHQRFGGDSWVPKENWLVLAKSQQVLPVYVIHYT
eukprot:m.75835 g.75835  ORF g.75835 m.75835 type:complete len:590 (+) comp14495_c1_seq3:333-2102(+)